MNEEAEEVFRTTLEDFMEKSKSAYPEFKFQGGIRINSKDWDGYRYWQCGYAVVMTPKSR
ncbi:hypothetical protein B7H23_00860 [Notoacmeibacter marinus]|uniref:Uncharacterized protein n=2 Tax=Notoacmeibacter marinus TaxID=1876515 RepID=A0A231V066_9HYPH|nr:hypothetical protein B7H23_00860 [Notoacmeibacter marinus]